MPGAHSGHAVDGAQGVPSGALQLVRMQMGMQQMSTGGGMGMHGMPCMGVQGQMGGMGGMQGPRWAEWRRHGDRRDGVPASNCLDLLRLCVGGRIFEEFYQEQQYSKYQESKGTVPPATGKFHRSHGTVTHVESLATRYVAREGRKREASSPSVGALGL